MFGYIFGRENYEGGTETVQYYRSNNSANYYIPTTLKNVTITGGNLYYGAFYNCTGLTNIVLGDFVQSVGEKAFYNCIGLTNIVVSNSVTSIGSSAFSGCSSLESITLPFVGGSASATEAGPDTLFGYIFGTDSYEGGASIRQYYSKNNYSTYCIPTTLKSVTIIGGPIHYGAFYNYTGLTSVTLGDSVTIIGDSAFNHCKKGLLHETTDSLGKPRKMPTEQGKNMGISAETKMGREGE